MAHCDLFSYQCSEKNIPIYDLENNYRKPRQDARYQYFEY